MYHIKRIEWDLYVNWREHYITSCYTRLVLLFSTNRIGSVVPNYFPQFHFPLIVCASASLSDQKPRNVRRRDSRVVILVFPTGLCQTIQRLYKLFCTGAIQNANTESHTKTAHASLLTFRLRAPWAQQAPTFSFHHNHLLSYLFSSAIKSSAPRRLVILWIGSIRPSDTVYYIQLTAKLYCTYVTFFCAIFVLLIKSLVFNTLTTWDNLCFHSTVLSYLYFLWLDSFCQFSKFLIP